MLRFISLMFSVCIIAPAVSAQVPAPLGTGAISGTVVGESGKPLAGVRLVYTKMPEFGPDSLGRRVLSEPGGSGSVTSATDGSFLMSNLAPGRYQVCTVPGLGQVGDCPLDGAALVPVGANQSVKNLRKKVYEGTVLVFRVVDPDRVVVVPRSFETIPRERRLLLGVMLGSALRSARLVSSSATELLFQVTVPRSMMARLVIDSDLNVTDESGMPLTGISRITKWIQPADTSRITLNVKQ